MSNWEIASRLVVVGFVLYFSFCLVDLLLDERLTRRH